MPKIIEQMLKFNKKISQKLRVLN